MNLSLTNPCHGNPLRKNCFERQLLQHYEAAKFEENICYITDKEVITSKQQ